MWLLLDIGNTRVKYALYQGGNFILREEIRGEVVTRLKPLFSEYKISHAIMAATGSIPESLPAFLDQHCALTELTHATPLPVRLAYNTPETLGADRVAAVVGASYQFPGRPVLVIDVGTCITLDFIDTEGTYRGGSISPGLDMRFKAMHTFTARLPLIPRPAELSLTGNSTRDCLASGALQGAVFEVDGFIQAYRHKYPGLKVILTGGDADFFESQLKSKIFAFPDLVEFGLVKILEYNGVKA